MFRLLPRSKKIAFWFRPGERDEREQAWWETDGRHDARSREIDAEWRIWHEKMQFELKNEQPLSTPFGLTQRIMQTLPGKRPDILRNPVRRMWEPLLHPRLCVLYVVVLAVLMSGWMSLEYLDMTSIEQLEKNMASPQSLPKPLAFQAMVRLESLPWAVLRHAPELHREKLVRLYLCLEQKPETAALFYRAVKNDPNSLRQIVALCGFVEQEFIDLKPWISQARIGLLSESPFQWLD